ncbi:MAG: OmpA family protein [Deltaproteobacteria bacterium]|nr:OmpA family protein [Deltaproteobacteria bacterium]
MALALFGQQDSVGSQQANLRFSLRRAKVIKKMLVQRGINPSRIKVEGKGSETPVAPNTTKSGRALNRRAEIRVRGSKF